MRQREIDHIDILNVLKNATAHFYVDQRGRSKAKCQFDDLTVIVEIMDGSELKVVTAWKNIYRCEFDVM